MDRKLHFQVFMAQNAENWKRKTRLIVKEIKCTILGCKRKCFSFLYLDKETNFIPFPIIRFEDGKNALLNCKIKLTIFSKVRGRERERERERGERESLQQHIDQ